MGRGSYIRGIYNKQTTINIIAALSLLYTNMAAMTLHANQEKDQYDQISCLKTVNACLWLKIARTKC